MKQHSINRPGVLKRTSRVRASFDGNMASRNQAAKNFAWRNRNLVPGALPVSADYSQEKDNFTNRRQRKKYVTLMLSKKSFYSPEEIFERNVDRELREALDPAKNNGPVNQFNFLAEDAKERLLSKFVKNGLSPEILFRQIEKSEILIFALQSLAPSERQMVTMRFGLDGKPACNVIQIAKEMGLKLNYVRWHLKQALVRLREFITNQETI